MNTLYIIQKGVKISLGAPTDDISIIKEYILSPLLALLSSLAQKLYLDKALLYFIKNLHYILIVFSIFLLIYLRKRLIRMAQASYEGLFSFADKQLEDIKLINEINFLEKQNKERQNIANKRKKELKDRLLFFDKGKKESMKNKISELHAMEKKNLSDEEKKERLEVITKGIINDEILAVIEKEERMSKEELSKKLGIELEKLDKNLAELKNEDLIILEDDGTIISKEKPSPPLSQLEHLFNIVNEKERITVNEAARVLGKPVKIIEKFAEQLSHTNLLDMEYKLGNVFLVSKEAREEEDRSKKEQEIKKRLTDAISEIEKIEETKAEQEVKRLFPTFNGNMHQRLEIERTMARRLANIKGNFSVSEVYKDLVETYPDQINPEDKLKVITELMDWIELDRTIAKDKVEDKRVLYKFVAPH